MYNKSQKYRVTIIDSGVSLDHPLFSNDKINGFGYRDGCIVDEFNDTYGHGTAVYNIIKKQCASDDILNIKLYNIENMVDEKYFINLLNYIYDHIEADILHMSLGLREVENYYELKEIFNRFESRNTSVIAAFDNLGSISYPAAFETVIGVTSSSDCVKINDLNTLKILSLISRQRDRFRSLHGQILIISF